MGMREEEQRMGLTRGLDASQPMNPAQMVFDQARLAAAAAAVEGGTNASTPSTIGGEAPMLPLRHAPDLGLGLTMPTRRALERTWARLKRSLGRATISSQPHGILRPQHRPTSRSSSSPLTWYEMRRLELHCF